VLLESKVALVGAGAFTVAIVGIPMIVAGFGLLYITVQYLPGASAVPFTSVDGFMLPLVGSAEAANGAMKLPSWRTHGWLWLGWII
jgi:hypothetical protein